MYTDKEVLVPTSITDIMQTAYIDYSMSVIVSPGRSSRFSYSILRKMPLTMYPVSSVSTRKMSPTLDRSPSELRRGHAGGCVVK